MGDWNETAIASVLRPPCGGESRIKAIDSHQAARRDTILMEQSRIFTSSSAYLGHSWREFLLSCCSAEKRKSMNPNRSSPSALPVSLGKVDAHHSAGISQLPDDGRKKHGLPLLRADGSRAPTKLLLQDLIPKPNKVAVNVQTTLPGEDAPSAERWWKLPVDVPFPFDFVIFVDRLERLLLREQFSRGRVEQFQTEQFDSIRMLFHL
ncbi:hypothetical protein AGDE_14248 [Angomonas deanei]|nr:hypothetical protein AGDE_14248 [Angomonas deanei]|eukprot:EPY21188.1 hypothetical protein AGDE_14248 [Angomonas deanei]